MTFYGERFRRPDEEDIWEELRQMLLNPPSQEEINLKKQQEQAKIDAAMERMFPDEKKVKKEPYLTKEELFGSEGQATGMAAPLVEGKISYELPRDPFKEIDKNPDWSNEEKAQRKELVAQSMKKYKDENNKINREHAWEQTKNYGGAALEIGSAFVPGYGGAKLAGAVAKKLAPTIGRKLAQEITTGTLKGASSGTLEGLGRGLMEDKNPLVTAAQDTVLSAASGGALGVGTGTVAQQARNKAVKELKDKRNDWGIAYTKQSGKPDEAIEKLLKEQQGFVPKAIKKKGIGDIDFVWGKQNYETGQGYGLEHIIDGRSRKNKVDGEIFVKKIPNTISTGILTKDTKRPSNIYIEDINNKIVVPNNWQGKKRNWVLTAYPQNKSASKRLAADAPMSKPNVDSRYTNFTTELTADNNIINNSNTNLNPQASNQTLQQPKSHNQWLEELKKKRKKRGWF